MKKLKLITKAMGYFLVILVFLLIVALVAATLTDYRPSARQALLSQGNAVLSEIKTSELNFLSWNIGYGGLGKEMDFFYEGGKMARPDPENSTRYLNGIQSFIETSKQDDFILLQEADMKAKRSFWKNQPEIISQILESHDFVFAKNYDVFFVPVPVNQPMGRVVSGLITFSRCKPVTSERVSLPGDLSWPSSLFMLDRCYLVQRFVTANGKVLLLMNTHNSAFDDGEIRKKQLDQLNSEALSAYQNGAYVVVGGDWNLNPPGFDPLQISNGDSATHNAAGSIWNNLFPTGWTWAYDDKKPTNRFVNSPYSRGKTPTTIIDFFVLSPNIELLEVNTVDLNFENSDHNPVKIKVSLK